MRGRLTGLRGLVRDDPLVRNSTFIMGSTVVGSGLGYLYWLVADRSYPLSAVGLGTALVSAMTLTSLLSNPALHSLVVQVLPARRSGAEWSLTVTTALVVAAVTGAVAGVVGAGVLGLLSRSYAPVTDPWAVAVFAAGVASWTVSMVVDYVCVAERSAGPMLVRTGMFGVAKLALLLAVPVVTGSGRDGVVILASWTVANLVSCAWVIARPLRRLGRGSGLAWRGMGGELVRLSRSVTGHHLANLGSMLPMYALPLEVAARLPLRDNAYFYTTWMVASLFFTVSPAVSSSLFAEGTHATEDLGAVTRRALRTIGVLLAGPMLVFLVGGRLVLATFGSGFASHGAWLLVLLVASAVPDAATNVYVSVLRVRRRLQAAAWLNLAMAGATLVAAWFLLPVMGIAAAGVAWLGAQVGGTVWVAVDLRWRRPIAPTPTPTPSPGPTPVPVAVQA